MNSKEWCSYIPLFRTAVSWKMKTSAEEKLMASRNWRRASAHNSRVEQSLQKEKCRLERQFDRDICQLKAAQNRFELQYRKTSTTERKTSLVLPPVHEDKDIGLEENNELLKKASRVRRMSKSLDSLPPLTSDSLTASKFNVGTRRRSSSVNSAQSDPVITFKSDITGETGTKDAPRRRISYAGLSVANKRLQQL